MKNVIKKIAGIVAGKSFSQSFFELLYKAGLFGMNIGGSSNLKVNGEINVLHYIKSRLNLPPVVFDVGANVGAYIEALRKVFDEIEIHAFEPLQANFSQLKDKFNDDSKVKLIRKGIGDKKTQTTIYFNPELGSMASVYQRQIAHHHFEINTSETIELDTLDNYTAENKIQKIDFLKLDIEGHELAALQGAKNLLSEKKVRFIQFEFGGTNIDSKTYFRDFWYLLSPQYKICRIVKDGLKEIKFYNENNEIFGYVNYLAELR